MIHLFPYYSCIIMKKRLSFISRVVDVVVVQKHELRSSKYNTIKKQLQIDYGLVERNKKTRNLNCINLNTIFKIVCILKQNIQIRFWKNRNLWINANRFLRNWLRHHSVHHLIMIKCHRSWYSRQVYMFIKSEETMSMSFLRKISRKWYGLKECCSVSRTERKILTK